MPPKLVELVDQAYDDVSQPARRARSIVLGRGGRMIWMAVVNPDEIEISLPRVIVSVKELERIDHVPPRPVLRRDVSRATRFLDAPRCTGMTEEKSAALLGVRRTGVVVNRLKDRLRDFDCHRSSSQYRSPR